AAIVAFRVVAVEMVRGADTIQIADGAAQSHVARDKQATAPLPETADAGAIGGRQAVAPIHREQPQLIEFQFRQFRKYRVRLTAPATIACRHPERELPILVAQLRQEFGQATEARDAPV